VSVEDVQQVGAVECEHRVVQQPLGAIGTQVEHVDEGPHKRALRRA
jgi:hypothetical protein